MAPYEYAQGFGSHDPDRPRKLLLHRRQIDELVGKTKQQSLTLVPLSIYFRDGRAKVEVALARGRRTYDKIWEPLLKAKLGTAHGEVAASFIWSTIR